MEELNTHFEKIPPFKSLGDKLNVQSVHVVLASLSIAALLSTYRYFGNFVVNSVGTVYPALASLSSMDSPESNDNQWLTYWVLFSAANFFDYFTGGFMSLVPFYYTFKLFFIVYLFFPTTEGALAIHKRFVFPVLLRYPCDEWRSKIYMDSKFRTGKSS